MANSAFLKVVIAATAAMGVVGAFMPAEALTLSPFAPAPVNSTSVESAIVTPQEIVGAKIEKVWWRRHHRCWRCWHRRHW